MFTPDQTPIESDWDDIHDLLKDMRAFAQAHPEHEFIPADDPGANYNPPRVPRVGWVAFRRNKPEEAAESIKRLARGETVPDYDEQMKSWTISVFKLQAALTRDKPMDDALWECLKSSAGRKKLLETVVSACTGASPTSP